MTCGHYTAGVNWRLTATALPHTVRLRPSTVADKYFTDCLNRLTYRSEVVFFAFIAATAFERTRRTDGTGERAFGTTLPSRTNDKRTLGSWR